MTAFSDARHAHLSGGPLDGRLHPVDGDVEHLDVTAADESRHRYNRVGCLVPDAEGTVLFEWSGRLG
jgi:hypothetical protein